MAKRFLPHSLNPRLLLASFFGVSALFLGLAGIASTPSTGTLTPTTTVLNYSAGPFRTPNQSPLGAGQLDSGPRCNTTTFPCDNYLLTVTLPSGYHSAHPNAAVRVTMSWVDATAAGGADYDLYIYKGNVTTTDGSTMADYQSASGNNPEVASVSPLADGTQQYSIKIVPYTPTGETVQVHIELLPGSASTGGGGTPVVTVPFGNPDPTVVGSPRFQNFYAPKGTSAEDSSGEFNIGYNPATNRIMTMNSGPIWRITPPESLTPPLPQCCEGYWEDKSSTVTNTGLDPILWVDQKSGRTMASNSTAGANAVYAYSDNDGDTYIPIGAAPPNGGADHQTIGSGPYPASLTALATAVNQGQAVYYCSQDVVGPASCARSDTLGSSYGAGVFAYYGQSVTMQNCGGLHGHIHVAPNGSAWLPVNQCVPTTVDGTATGATNAAGTHYQGGTLTADGGVTWQEFIVPKALSQANGSDPSIAIDADSTVYYAYVNNEPVASGNPLEGHARVKVGKRNATTGVITWSNDYDIGASHGIVNAAEIEAVGGSSGRAAVAFLGTNMPGDYQNIAFPGKWYAFIALTYDGGVTWTTVNATPNDPVQSLTGIWQQGGGATQRNLLDFTEITVDKNGRVLYGYSDGCVSVGCIAGTAPNDFEAFMRVARQSGGKTIYASYDQYTDTTAPILPKPSCLSGTRSTTASSLTWKVPDNGGSDIVNYQIFRGTSTGNEVLIGQTGSAKNAYTDTTADPNVPHYFYVVKAINAVGTGLASNEVDLVAAAAPVIENVCALPGRTILTDASGDNVPPSTGTDLHSFQISQPYSTDGVLRLGFTINTDPGQNPQPANTSWYVAMKLLNGATTSYKGVHMTYKSSSPTTPTFESYTPAAGSNGTVDGRFVTSGTEVPAETSSNYNTTAGKITIVVKASDLGLSAGQTIAGFVSGVSVTAVAGTALVDAMPDGLAYTGLYTIQANTTCAPSAVGITSVVSRKTHSAAGTYDLNLPLTGTRAIEPRTGGDNGNHTLVFTFNNPITSIGSVNVTSGTGSVSSTSLSGNTFIVYLTGVTNAQVITVSLTNVQSAANEFSNLISVPMGVLLGDVNASGRTDNGDVTVVRSKVVSTVDSTNFLNDVNLSGRIDNGDVTVVRQYVVTALP